MQWGEIWNRLKERKNVTSADKIFFGRRIITPVSLLSSRIFNKNAFGRSRRKFI